MGCQLFGRPAIVEIFDREPLEQGCNLRRRAFEAFVPRQLGEPGERVPREWIDEESYVEPTAHQLRCLHRPPQCVELASIDPPFLDRTRSGLRCRSDVRTGAPSR